MKLKYIFLILLSLAVSLSCISQKTKQWVFDKEHDLTQSQINKLEGLFKTHEVKTSNEIVLVTTKDYYPDTNIVSFAMNFGNKYGIGKKDKDNGIVIAYSKNRREVRISIGYGMEKILKDDFSKKIIDNLMTPLFRQGKTFDGIWEGCKAIIDFLEKPENKIN